MRGRLLLEEIDSGILHGDDKVDLSDCETSFVIPLARASSQYISHMLSVHEISTETCMTHISKLRNRDEGLCRKIASLT